MDKKGFSMRRQFYRGAHPSERPHPKSFRGNIDPASRFETIEWSVRKLYGDRRPHILIGLDETLFTAGLDRDEYLQFVFAAMTFDPNLKLNGEKIPNGKSLLSRRGMKRRKGSSYDKIRRVWWNKPSNPFNTLKYCLFLGKEASSTKEGRNFLTAIPHLTKSYLSKMGNKGGLLRVFLDGDANESNIQSIKSSLEEYGLVEVWDVPKNSEEERLEGLTARESRKAYELIAVSDALAYRAQRKLRAVKKGEFREEIKGKALMDLVSHGKNAGIVYNDTVIHPEELDLAKFGNGSRFRPRDLIGLCEETIS